MKKRVKRMAKDAMIVGATGVGLGLMGSVAGDSPAAASSIGTLGKGVGVAGGVMMMGHTIGFLNDAIPQNKKKKKGGWY